MFFTAINQMMTEGVDLTLVIRKANGQMAVSVLPKSNGLKDEAQNHIIPLTLKGVPQELDTGFLQAVARPVQKATGLITNMAQFEAQADKAAADSKAAKEEKAKETKEEKEKREKYEKHLKKAEELIAAGKHSEAVSALGQARLHAKPQDLKKIDSMVEEQKKAMNKGSLFGRFGRGAQALAAAMLERGLVGCVASDAHGPDVRTPDLAGAWDYLAERCSEELARCLLEDNPGRILRSEPLPEGRFRPFF